MKCWIDGECGISCRFVCCICYVSCIPCCYDDWMVLICWFLCILHNIRICVTAKEIENNHKLEMLMEEKKNNRVLWFKHIKLTRTYTHTEALNKKKLVKSQRNLICYEWLGIEFDLNWKNKNKKPLRICLLLRYR